MSFTLRHTSPRDDKTVTAHNGRLTIRGRLADNGLRFEAQLQVITQGGRRTDEGQSVRVEGADSAVLLLSAGTDYADTYPTYRGDDPHDRVTAAVDAAARTGHSYTLRNEAAATPPAAPGPTASPAAPPGRCASAPTRTAISARPAAWTGPPSSPAP